MQPYLSYISVADDKDTAAPPNNGYLLSCVRVFVVDSGPRYPLRSDEPRTINKIATWMLLGRHSCLYVMASYWRQKNEAKLKFFGSTNDT